MAPLVLVEICPLICTPRLKEAALKLSLSSSDALWDKVDFGPDTRNAFQCCYCNKDVRRVAPVVVDCSPCPGQQASALGRRRQVDATSQGLLL